MIGRRFFMVLTMILTIVLTTAQGTYFFKTICQSSFASSNNLFCILAYDDIGQFEFFIPTSEQSKNFTQTSEMGDELVFYVEDITMDIDCQTIKQSVTFVEAATNPGIRALFATKCLWSNNGASRISVQNIVHSKLIVVNAFAISFFPPVEDWYADFLRSFLEEVQSKPAFDPVV